MDADPDRRGEEMRARGDYESGPLVRSVAMSANSVGATFNQWTGKGNSQGQSVIES
jgi:hypothetical protein